MTPPGFNQPNVQNNQGNQSRYQGNNFNSNQNREDNFNQNRQNNQGAVYQAPPYQPPTNQPLVNQALPPVSQIQGVSKTDFESYAKANDANMNNLQMKLDNFQRNQNDFQRSYNDSQKKQDDFQNMMLGFMQNDHNNSTASTSRSGPSTPLVPTPDVSIPSKEPEQNLETSTEKVQNSNLENSAQVPPLEEEESIFMEIQKTKAKKTVNVEIQDLNSPRPNSYPSKLPYPERMKVRENDKPIQTMVKLVARNKVSSRQFASPTVNAKCSAIIMKKVPEKLKDPGKFLIPCVLQELNRTSALDDSGASFNFYSHSIYKPLGLFDPFSGITTTLFYDPSPSSSPVKTSDNFEKFADELAPLDSLPPGNDDSTLKKDLHEENFQDHSNPLFEFDDNFKSSTINPLFDEMEEDVEIKNSNVSDEPVLLNTPLSDKVECFAPEDNNDEIDAFLAMEVSSNFEEGYFDSEGDVTFLDNLLSDDASHNLASEVISDHEPEQNESSITFSPRSDPLHHEFAGEVITLPSRNDREFGEYLSLMTVLCEISTSQSQENVHTNQSTVIESLPVSPIPVEDSEPAQEEIDIFLVPDDLIPPGVENDDSEDEDNELPNLDHQDDPSIPRPPPEPPDVEKCFEPEAGILITKVFKGVSKSHDFMANILPTLPTLVSDLTFILFLSSFLSFGNEDTIFDPGIFT
ncbi:hypothetical protein Tco_1213370 [Tanacetum coccineum]